MQTRRIAAVNTILFFFFWLIVLLAGPEFPPPPGFLWLIIAVAACAFVVYWRVPTYIEWIRTQRPGRHWRVVLEGFAAASSSRYHSFFSEAASPQLRHSRSITPSGLPYSGLLVPLIRWGSISSIHC